MSEGDCVVVGCRKPDVKIRDRRMRHPDAIVAYEEEGTLWLWAFPTLLGNTWEGVNWLFAPVTGKHPWPGDLWGLDARGDLLIVETKLAGARGVDPFADFIGFDKANAKFRDKPVISATSLRDRWEKMLHGEHTFIKDCQRLLSAKHLRPKQWRRRVWPGVVPYSSKRVVVWRWRELYRQRIKGRINGKRYRDEVHRSLGQRDQQGNPLPHYIGLITLPPETGPRLSSVGARNYQALVNEVGRDKVHLRAVKVTEVDDDLLTIACRTVDMPTP